MSAERTARSLARAEASRRNGALSKGPCTALGKLKASQNARKHGLFCEALLVGAKLPAAAADLEGLLAPAAAGWLDLTDQSEVVRGAALQLEESTRQLADMREELDRLLADEDADNVRLDGLLQRIARVARYQRRFRGRRDRALRRLMATTTPDA